MLLLLTALVRLLLAVLLLAVLAVVLLAALALLRRAALLLSAFITGTRFVAPFSKGTHARRVLEPFLGSGGRSDDLNTLSAAAGVAGIKGGILYKHVKN